jgi:hypothetical protein
MVFLSEVKYNQLGCNKPFSMEYLSVCLCFLRILKILLYYYVQLEKIFYNVMCRLLLILKLFKLYFM